MSVDARLLGPAAAAWIAAAVARSALLAIEPVQGRAEAAHMTALGSAVLAGLAGAALASYLGLRARRRAAGQRRAGRFAAVMIAAMTALIAVTVSATAVVAVAPAPVAGWVDERATATVDGVVTAEPRTGGGSTRWGRPRQELRFASSAIYARGAAVEVDLPMLLRLGTDAFVPAPGTRVRAIGRLGPAGGGGEAQIALRVSRLDVLDRPGAIDRATQAMRTGLRAALADVAPEPAALVAGLALGDESMQPEGLADAMRASGLSHLTAVSGGNLAVLLGLVIAITSVLRASLRARTLASIGAVAAFTVLVGAQPSVLRAVAMGVIATIGALLGGRRGGPSVLGAGILLLVLVAPWLTTSWGFALSALATAGIVLLVAPIEDLLGRSRWTARWPVGLRAAVALTLAAQLGALPVLVVMGGAVGWVGLPANLLAAPLVPIVTVPGLIAAVLAPVIPSAAEVLAHLAAVPAGAIAWIAHAGAAAPLGGLPWPSGWPGAALLGAATAGALVGRRVLAGQPAARARGVRRWATAVVAVVIAALVVAPPGRRGWPPPNWLAIMCDVGQGDAVILNAGPEAAVVVDAGPDPGAVERCLDDAGIEVVPALVLTHFHADHVDGLPGVLRGRQVELVLVDPVREPVDRARAVDATLAAAGLTATTVAAGDARIVGAVTWTVLWPRRVITAGSIPNNSSLVLAATVSGRTILLTGDVEAEAQIAVGPDLRGHRFDVVKVPHHGSANAAADLPQWVSAPLALVSVGADNGYGLPAASTLAAWTRAGSMVVRSDESGDVAVVPVGSQVGIVTRG